MNSLYWHIILSVNLLLPYPAAPGSSHYIDLSQYQAFQLWCIVSGFHIMQAFRITATGSPEKKFFGGL